MLIICNERKNMKVKKSKKTKKKGYDGYIQCNKADTKSKVKKLNNGHIVQKDYFVLSITSRYPNVRLCPNSMKI